MENKNISLNKVAQITLFFWIMKIIATTLGEMFGDYLSMTLNMGYTIGLGVTLAFLLIVLFIQLKVSKFYAPIYWLVIVGTTTVGTEISDLIDRTLGIGYIWGSVLLFALLALTLYLWHKTQNGIKVYPITNRKIEVFYWVAILISNSLGTAFGDYLSDNLELSYLTGAIITGLIILVVVLLHYYTQINQVLLFWIAFIFTRPFGATFGDFLTKPIDDGGLNFGRGTATIIASVLLIIVLFFSVRNDKEQIALDKTYCQKYDLLAKHCSDHLTVKFFCRIKIADRIWNAAWS